MGIVRTIIVPVLLSFRRVAAVRPSRDSSGPGPHGGEPIVRARAHLRVLLSFAFVLSLAGVLLAQGTPEKSDKTFVVNGKTVSADLLDVDGRLFVDVQSLAQITNGTVTVEPDRIVLTIPTSSTPTPAANTATNAEPQQTVPGMSKDFATLSIGSLAEMREWRGAIGTMITYGLAVSSGWAQSYHDRAQQALEQATVAAATDSDRDALSLLRNEFDTLSAWASDAIAARQALNGAKTIDPNSLQNDQTLAKITDCSQFLSAMLVSGVFADNSNCH